MEESALELLEGLEEFVEELPPAWQAEFLPASEWMDRAFDLFSAVLSWIMANEFLRLFAVLSVVIVAFNLLASLLRIGKSLSR